MSSQTTIIDDNLILNGRLILKYNLRIEGIVSGSIHCKGSITVSSKGHIDGEVVADTIYSNGKIYGKLIANKIYLKKSAIFCGKIQTSYISIENEDFFDGEITIKKKSELLTS